MSDLWIIGAALAALVASWGGVALWTRRNVKQAEKAKADKAYRETRGRMDDANAVPDADDARDWLRKRGQ